MRIKSWNLFLEKRELDLLNESIVYFSPEFREALKKIKDPVAADLLNYEEELDRERDISFIDLYSEEGYVSFKTMKSMMNQIKDSDLVSNKDNILSIERKPDYYWSDKIYNLYPDIWKQSRNPIRLGSLIQKLFPGRWDANRDIEPFVTKFKSLQRGDVMDKIEIVEGKDIAYWYEEENYLENEGTLGNSCMKSVDRNYFDIYTKNPDICKMACIFQDDEEGEKKIVGRALLWKVTTIEPAGRFNSVPQFEWLMDRRYSTEDGYSDDLRKWADKMGYAYKTRNNFGSMQEVSFNSQNFECVMTIQLDNYTFQKFPYMDTFRKFDPKTGILYNDDIKGSEYAGMYILNKTNGGFDPIPEGIWSQWHSQYISEESAVYSVSLDDHILRNRAVEIKSGSSENLGWWPLHHDDVVVDGWSREHIILSDAVKSKSRGYFILAENAIQVVAKIMDGSYARCGDCWLDYFPKDDFMSYNKLDQYREDFWFKVLSGKFPNWNRAEGISKELIIGVIDLANNTRKISLQQFVVDLFKTEGDSDFEWLDRTAAEFLGIEIGGNHKICCGLEYVNSLKEKLGAEWIQLEEMLEKVENRDYDYEKFRMILKTLRF